MKDYLVEIEFFQDSSIEFIHFCSEYHIGTEPFFNDVYDAIFSRGYDISDFRILSVEEGYCSSFSL